MPRTISLLVGVALAFAAPLSAGQAGPKHKDEAAALLAKADAILSPAAFTADITMVTRRSDGGTRTYRMRTYKKSRDQVLVVFSYPEIEKGRKILRLGEDLWMYLPSVKKTIKVSSKEQLLGGDFTNGDVTRLNLTSDYRARLDSSKPRQGGVVLRLNAIDRSVCYDRILFEVSVGEGMPLREEYYTSSGKLIKTLDFSAVQDYAGFRRPAHFDMENRILKNKSTVLTYDRFDRVVEIQDSLFLKSSLGDF